METQPEEKRRAGLDPLSSPGNVLSPDSGRWHAHPSRPSHGACRKRTALPAFSKPDSNGTSGETRDQAAPKESLKVHDPVKPLCPQISPEPPKRTQRLTGGIQSLPSILVNDPKSADLRVVLKDAVEPPRHNPLNLGMRKSIGNGVQEGESVHHVAECTRLDDEYLSRQDVGKVSSGYGVTPHGCTTNPFGPAQYEETGGQSLRFNLGGTLLPKTPPLVNSRKPGASRFADVRCGLFKKYLL